MDRSWCYFSLFSFLLSTRHSTSNSPPWPPTFPSAHVLVRVVCDQALHSRPLKRRMPFAEDLFAKQRRKPNYIVNCSSAMHVTMAQQRQCTPCCHTSSRWMLPACAPFLFNASLQTVSCFHQTIKTSVWAVPYTLTGGIVHYTHVLGKRALCLLPVVSSLNSIYFCSVDDLPAAAPQSDRSVVCTCKRPTNTTTSHGQ